MSSDLNGNSNDDGKDVQPTNFDVKKNKSISLKVAEAEQRDVGRKIARVDPAVAERLNIATGDALEIDFTWKNNNSFKLAGEGNRQKQGSNPDRRLCKK